MKRGTVFGLLALSFLITNSALSQSGPIHKQIQETYNFQPHLLTNQEIKDKSAVLDQFWTAAKAKSSVYIPSLRQELRDFRNPPFFLYDGSMLLLSLSDTPTDRQIALAALAHCDLRDVQPKDYFHQVHRMATLDENTAAAAFHILAQPKFSVFIPLHVLTLGQDYALLYMLMPTDPDYWLQPAIDRLKVELDPTAQKSLLLLLWYAQTNAADQAISAFAGDAAKPTAAQTYARELMGRKERIGMKERSAASNQSEESIRNQRRERLKVVSDEALIDLDDYTMTLMTKRK
jgi:hypothetical protein